MMMWISKISFLTFKLVLLVIVLSVLSAVFLGGCNTEWIGALKKDEITTKEEVAKIEAEIAADTERLASLTLDEDTKTEIKAGIAKNESMLNSLNRRLDDIQIELQNAVKEDDTMIATIGKEIDSLTPLGYGGLGTSLLLLFRGFLQKRSMKDVLRSVQPLVDEAEKAGNVFKETVGTQTKAATKLVKSLKSESLLSRI